MPSDDLETKLERAVKKKMESDKNRENLQIGLIYQFSSMAWYFFTPIIVAIITANFIVKKTNLDSGNVYLTAIMFGLFCGGINVVVMYNNMKKTYDNREKKTGKVKKWWE